MPSTSRIPRPILSVDGTSETPPVALRGGSTSTPSGGALGRLHSTLPEQEVVAGLRAFGDSSLRMGVTTVQNMAGYLDPGLTTRAFRRSAVKRAKLWLLQRNAAVILANVDRGVRTASEVED